MISHFYEMKKDYYVSDHMQVCTDFKIIVQSTRSGLVVATSYLPISVWTKVRADCGIHYFVIFFNSVDEKFPLTTFQR